MKQQVAGSFVNDGPVLGEVGGSSVMVAPSNCGHYTHPDARKRTPFLVHAPQRIIRTVPEWEHQIG